MKKALSLVSLAGFALLLFVCLPYLPPTVFSTLFVVGCMIALAFLGHRLYKKTTFKTPILTQEELESLEDLLEGEGEAVSDNEVPMQLTDSIADIVQNHKDAADAKTGLCTTANISQQKQREEANKKQKRRKKKRLAKHSRQQNR